MYPPHKNERISVIAVQIPVPTPTPESGSFVVGENNPNPNAAVIKLSVAKTAAAVTAPARIDPQERLFPAGSTLVALS